MKVYDRRQDAEKSAFRKLYEKIVNGVADLLENRKRDEVATKAEISGPVENPKHEHDPGDSEAHPERVSSTRSSRVFEQESSRSNRRS